MHLCHAGGGDAAEEDRVGKVHTGVFSKDLPWLMYGFGDADKPLKVGGWWESSHGTQELHLDMCRPSRIEACWQHCGRLHPHLMRWVWLLQHCSSQVAFRPRMARA
jgi:hypothetical protein